MGFLKQIALFEMAVYAHANKKGFTNVKPFVGVARFELTILALSATRYLIQKSFRSSLLYF